MRAATVAAVALLLATALPWPAPVTRADAPAAARPSTSDTPPGLRAASLGSGRRGADAVAESVGATATVEIATTGAREADVAAAEVARLGGSVIGGGGDVPLLASVPAGAVDALVAAVPGDVREPVPVDVRPEGTAAVRAQQHAAFGPTSSVVPSITNATTWHAAGITGAGVKVGVIDFFDTTYWNVAEMGPVPVAGVTAKCFDLGNDCTGEFFDGIDAGGENHGPAVVEVLKDMAPDVQVVIGRATTAADYRSLVDWFADNGVTVVNRSLGSRYDGPGDGRGALDDVADHAVDRGITWVNSGGNNAVGRYYRHRVRLVGNLVAFGQSGSETWLRMSGCASPGGLRWANDWDVPPAQRSDYDLIVRLAPTGNPDGGVELLRSEARQSQGAPPLEVVLGDLCPPPGQSIYIRLALVSGDPTGDVIEMLDYDDGFSAFTQTTYSSSTPIVDSRNAGVLAVGAVDPPASGGVASYGSQGPTNDERVKPDLTAPSGGTSTVFAPSRFSGTSAAAPVVAGTAALLRQAGAATGPRELGDLVRYTVIDRGVPGPDNAYGAGELRLPAPPTIGAVPARPSRYVPLDAPTRVLDTRTTGPIGPPALIGELWPGEIVDLPIAGTAGVPASGVTAVAVNVTIVHARRPGYGQVLPTWTAAIGASSTFNVDTAEQTRPNLAIVPVSADGRISVYANTGGDLLVDVLGWFERADAPVAAGRLVSLPAPARTLDTRDRAGRLPVATGDLVRVPLPSGVDAAQVSALVVNVTVTEVVGEGYVQAVPAGRPADVGRTSTVNVTQGSTAANSVIVPVGPGGGVDLFSYFGAGGRAHVVADVTGYVTSSAAPVSGDGRFVPVTPARAYDSRNAGAPLGDDAVVTVDAATAPGVSVPPSASGLAVNVTATQTTRYGFVKAWPDGAPEPRSSALNWYTGSTTIANAAIVRPVGGRIALRVTDEDARTSGPLTHAIVDVVGWFT